MGLRGLPSLSLLRLFEVLAAMLALTEQASLGPSQPPPHTPTPVGWLAEAELDAELAGVKDSALRHTLQFGIGLHHAGLPDSDREAVERLYVAGKIQVGCLASAHSSPPYRHRHTGGPPHLRGFVSGRPKNPARSLRPLPVPPPAAPPLLQVLVATSTLAWGVNTPAHLVIIKGTEFYDAPTK